MRDAINEGDYSVSASIVNDGTNYRLVLTNKETGEANGIELTVQDDDGNNQDGTGLSRFTYSETTKNAEQTAAAQDAKIIMNGITISRASNEISNVIEGVTLNLNGETEIGKTVTLKINKDTSKVEEQIQAFVDNYNSTILKMNELTKAGGVGDSDGILNGDSTIRNIQSQMRSVLNTSVDHIQGSVKSFADLGILTNRDGTLSLDSLKFSNILKNDMDSVAEFFTASGSASDPMVSFESNSSLTKPGTYSVEVTQLATQGILTGTDIGLNFPLTIDADNDSFTMRVDGYLSGNINLSQKSYATIEELAIEMQSQINSDSNFVSNGISVNIANDAGKLAITSNKYGSSSTVAFTQVDTNFLTSVGLDVQGGINGVDAEGLIDGVAAFGDGQYLLSQDGKSNGIKLLIEGGALGSRGTVTYAEGVTKLMNDVLAGIIDANISSSTGDIEKSNTIIDGKIDSLYKKINTIDEQQTAVNYRMDKLEARLYKDFNAMDMAVSSLNNTMSYLKATLDALPGYTREK
ncbi:flagellar filament capping protein FliD [Psychromonas sp. MME2]